MVLAVKILAIWSAAALIIGLGIGALIRTGEQLRKEEFLAALFAAISARRPAR